MKLPAIATAVVSQAVTTEREVKPVTPEALAFAEDLTKYLHQATLGMTKNKPWIRAFVDNGGIVVQIAGPLRKIKVLDEKTNQEVDQVKPQFSNKITILSAKTLGTLLPYDGFNNHACTKDYLKRLHLATGLLIDLLEDAEKQAFEANKD